MSRQIKILIPLLVSLLVHAGLLGLFFFVLAHTLTPHQKLAPQRGGVVYFNLNPGGQGTGGQGGNGVSQEEIKKNIKKQEVKELNAANLKKPSQNSIKNIEGKTSQKPIVLSQKNTYSDKINQNVQASSSKKTNNITKHKGEGDGEGLHTGPAMGEGKGMGEGQGTGVGTGKGPGGKGNIGSGDPSGQGGEGKKVLSQILRKLNSKHRYPAEARRNKLEGNTQFVFKIQKDGSLQYARIVKSSGHPILDQAALRAVQKAAPFPYYPKEIRYGYRYSLKR